MECIISGYVWQIDLAKCYRGPKTDFSTVLLDRIKSYCEEIVELLSSAPADINSVKKILHIEKLINILLLTLSEPEYFYFYEDLEYPTEDFKNDQVDINNYTNRIANFNCMFKWLLVEGVNWKGDEDFCLSIFGK